MITLPITYGHKQISSGRNGGCGGGGGNGGGNGSGDSDGDGDGNDNGDLPSVNDATIVTATFLTRPTTSMCCRASASIADSDVGQ